MRTITVSVGNDALFRLLPGGVVLMPTAEKERADVISALRSALECFDAPMRRSSPPATGCDQD